MGTKKKTKKKTPQQKKKIKNKKDAKKIINLFNLSLQHINNGWIPDVFTMDDSILWTSGYIKTGVRRGWKHLQNKSTPLEVDCNSLCFTISILNFTILQKAFTKLNILEKLYLFFLSYLLNEKDQNKKKVSFGYALRKANIRIKQSKLKYETDLKNEGEDHRKTKQSLKMLNKRIKQKEELIQANKDDISIGYDSPLIWSYKIDKCNNIDCEYLHEENMKKSPQFEKVFKKFCEYIVLIFKGIVWLNLNVYFGKVKNPYKMSIINDTLRLNINIRKVMGTQQKNNLLLFPTNILYENIHHYTKKEKERLCTKDGKNEHIWVYKNLDLKKKKIQKVRIDHLENKHYIVGLMDTAYSGLRDVKMTKSEKVNENIKMIDDFVNGVTPLPVLKNVVKTTKSFFGKGILNLDENIDNSITIHWLVMHKSVMNDYITKSYWNIY